MPWATQSVKYIVAHGALEEINSRIEAQKDVMDLIPVTGDEAFEQMKLRILDNLPKLRLLQEKHAFLTADGIHNLIDRKLREAGESYSQTLASLARGQVPIERSDDELNTNFRFLETIPTKRVKAISYYDEEFWASEKGRNFLECNRKVIEDGVMIERVFILRVALTDEMRKLMSDQVAAGVSVYYVSEASLISKEYQPEDFVIYDETAVRVAQLVHQDDSSRDYEDKTATLLLSTEITTYLNKFQAIQRNATRFTP